jgi:hypothetical protein
VSTSKLLERILELPYARIRVIYWSCKGYGRKKVAEFCNIKVGGVDFQKDKAIEEFEDIIPELRSEEAEESKRAILIKALEKDVIELFEPYKIEIPDDLLPTKWEEIRNRKKYGLGGEAPKETEGEEPEIIDPPPRPPWEGLFHQINEAWNRIPEGLPRTLVSSIGLGVIVILLIWGLTECGGEPIPPTGEPPAEVAEVPPEEPTEVIQVAPPTDTEVPQPTAIPSETSTPTITYTPTLTPTPTVTHTPTIAPTNVAVGPDNLPLKFEGIFDEDVYAPTTFILHIEERSGDRVSGKQHYPDRSNTFIGWEGNVVHDFGDVIEQSRWEYVEGFGTEGGTWIKETRRWEIEGGFRMGGLNYYYISDTGRVTGVHIHESRSDPSATFELFISN